MTITVSYRHAGTAGTFSMDVQPGLTKVSEIRQALNSHLGLDVDSMAVRDFTWSAA